MHLRVLTWVCAGIVFYKILRGCLATTQAVSRSFGYRNQVNNPQSQRRSCEFDSKDIGGDLKRHFVESSEVDLTKLNTVRMPLFFKICVEISDQWRNLYLLTQADHDRLCPKTISKSSCKIESQKDWSLGSYFD